MLKYFYIDNYKEGSVRQGIHWSILEALWGNLKFKFITIALIKTVAYF